MITEVGHFLLTLAFFVAILQCLLPLIGAQINHYGLMAFARLAAVAQFLLLMGSFFALMHAFIVSDFTLRLVVLNSHSLKPMLYKISGTWGNHEGSMLLWALILTLFSAVLAMQGRAAPRDGCERMRGA